MDASLMLELAASVESLVAKASKNDRAVVAEIETHGTSLFSKAQNARDRVVAERLLEAAMAAFAFVCDARADDRGGASEARLNLGNALSSLGSQRGDAEMLRRARSTYQDGLARVDGRSDPRARHNLTVGLANGDITIGTINDDPEAVRRGIDLLKKQRSDDLPLRESMILEGNIANGHSRLAGITKSRKDCLEAIAQSRSAWRAARRVFPDVVAGFMRSACVPYSVLVRDLGWEPPFEEDLEYYLQLVQELIKLSEELGRGTT